MTDWDIDGNGIPDAIQADPVIVPPEPAPFTLVPPELGLPGMDAPIGATAEATSQQIPEPPAMPAAPPADADEATMADYERSVVEYQHAMQKYSQMLEAVTNIQNLQHETARSVIQNIRA